MDPRQSGDQRRGADGNPLAIAGFVCSLVALLFAVAASYLPALGFVGFAVLVAAFVLSAMGLHRASRHGLPHRGLAIAGLVIALLQLVLALLVVVITIL